MRPRILGNTLFLLSAAWFTPAPGLLAQAPFPCNGQFYQSRSSAAGMYELDVIDRSVTPYVLTPLFDIGRNVNALGFNSVDGFLYEIPNPVTATEGIIRMGMTGLVDLDTGTPGVNGAPVTGLVVGNGYISGSFDKQGNFFVGNNGGAGSINRITGVTGVNPTPAATLVPQAADPSPPPGYTGTATFRSNDFAVSPTESTPSLTVFYGAYRQGANPVTLIRGVITNPSSATPTAVLATIATDLSLAGTVPGSAFFDASGAFYIYDNNATPAAGFYLVDLATGATMSVSGAPPTSGSDGGSCAFPSETVDVVKAAAAPSQIDNTTWSVAYTVLVGNLSAISIPNVQVSDDLALTFAAGAPTITITAGPTVSAGSCVANTVFDGTSDFRLLSGSDSLAAGASCTITFTTSIAYPTPGAVPTAAQDNSAYASSTSTGPNPGYTFPNGVPVPPADLLASDVSTNGSTLPPTANGDTPSPTPVQFLVSDVSIVKTDGSASATPGSPIVYTITVSNAGPSAVVGASVTDTFPAVLLSPSWTCVASAGSSCAQPGPVAGNIATTVSLAVGGTATFTVTATVSPGATGTLANTASVAAPPGVTDPNPGNNSSTDSDSLAPSADLSVVKSGPTAVDPGAVVTYTIVVTNNGPSDVNGLTLTDVVPAELTNVQWTCTATGIATCGVPNGTGNAIVLTGSLAAGPGNSLTIVVTGTAGSSGTLVNTATVSVPPGTTDPAGGNDSSSVTTVIGAAAAANIPTLSTKALLALAALLAAIALWRLRIGD
ncbi:MAG: DUF11 domain-containing protein [Acidobacteriota bacterium]